MDWIKRAGIRVTGFRFILAVSFAAVIILSMTFVGFALNQKFIQTSRENLSENSREIIEQVERNLDNYLKGMIDLSNLLVIDINKFKELNLPELDRDIETLMRTRTDILSISLFTTDGKLLYEGTNLKLKDTATVLDESWFKTAMGGNGDTHISPPHVQNLYKNRHPWVITLSRKVNFRINQSTEEGVLMIDMNFSVIEDLINDVTLGKKGYVFILDNDNNLVYHHQQQLIYSGVKSEKLDGIFEREVGSFVQIDSSGENRILTIYPASHVNWKLVGAYYLSDLTAAQKDLTQFIVLTLALGMVIFISVSIYMTDRITKPIAELEDSMRAVERGDFNIRLDVQGEYEVVQLARRFNLMTSQIKSLMSQVVSEQESKRKSELSALQAQINPHFLYNTLDSVIWMAESGKHQEVVKMVTALARLFSISRGRNVISVKEELAHAENYLTIQKMRYKDQFEYTFEIEDEVLSYKTQKLVLQPIIENAIYHGIRQMVDEGEITIRAYLQNNILTFEVEDNGLGMSEDVRSRVLVKHKDDDDETVRVGGVGVTNVYERIQLMYGEAYGIEIESEIEEGTKVILTIPAVKGESS